MFKNKKTWKSFVLYNQYEYNKNLFGKFYLVMKVLHIFKKKIWYLKIIWKQWIYFQTWINNKQDFKTWKTMKAFVKYE